MWQVIFVSVCQWKESGGLGTEEGRGSGVE